MNLARDKGFCKMKNLALILVCLMLLSSCLNDNFEPSETTSKTTTQRVTSSGNWSFLSDNMSFSGDTLELSWFDNGGPKYYTVGLTDQSSPDLYVIITFKEDYQNPGNYELWSVLSSSSPGTPGFSGVIFDNDTSLSSNVSFTWLTNDIYEGQIDGEAFEVVNNDFGSIVEFEIAFEGDWSEPPDLPIQLNEDGMYCPSYTFEESAFGYTETGDGVRVLGDTTSSNGLFSFHFQQDFSYFSDPNVTIHPYLITPHFPEGYRGPVAAKNLEFFNDAGTLHTISVGGHLEIVEWHNGLMYGYYINDYAITGAYPTIAYLEFVAPYPTYTESYIKECTYNSINENRESCIEGCKEQKRVDDKKCKDDNDGFFDVIRCRHQASKKRDKCIENCKNAYPE